MTVQEALAVLTAAEPNPVGVDPEYRAMRVLILHLMELVKIHDEELEVMQDDES